MAARRGLAVIGNILGSLSVIFEEKLVLKKELQNFWMAKALMSSYISPVKF